MQILTNRILIIMMSLFTALMIGLAIVGAYQLYTPVPILDMWGGGIQFFINLNDGISGIWWAQHNEHRILLTRLLFWVDLNLFAGTNLFLIIINYVLVGLSALLFWRIIRAVTEKINSTISEMCFTFLIIAWLFLWSQYHNLTDPFQSQFFLAQLLPLCAFYWLYKATESNYRNFNFLIACGFGIVSIMTMANGIFTVPLMTFYAILTRQGKLRIACLGIIAIICSCFYLYDFHSVSHHGSIIQSVKNHPLELLNYIFIYLGNPFYYLLQSKDCAAFAGFILVMNSIFFLFKLVSKGNEAGLKLALLFFIFYIELTAFCTGGGRLIFGIDQAVSSRYTTPSIMAWAALFVLYLPSLLGVLKAKYKKPQSAIYIVLIVILMFYMLNFQLTALKPQDKLLFEKRVAALALQVGVNDPMQINSIYNSNLSKELLSIVKVASAKKLSCFGQYPFLEMRQLGDFVAQPILSKCQVSSLSIEHLASDARFVRVSGWIASPFVQKKSQAIRFLNHENKIVGYAFTGKSNSALPYVGYTLSDQIGRNLIMQTGSFSCQLHVNDIDFDKFDSQKISIANHCEGNIDIINEASAAAFTANKSLNVRGWLAKSVDTKGELPESVLIVLTDSKGKKLFFRTRYVDRPDVGTYFKNPLLNASGFISEADISKIKGNYTLGLAYTESDLIKICPQFKISGMFNQNES